MASTMKEFLENALSETTVINERLSGGLFDRFKTFTNGLQAEMIKAANRRMPKQGDFKVKWTNKDDPMGYAFSMKGYTRSDLEAELMFNFWFASMQPATFRMVINGKTPEGQSDFFDKTEGFMQYDPKRFANIAAQYMGY